MRGSLFGGRDTEISLLFRKSSFDLVGGLNVQGFPRVTTRQLES